jgi:hypothetical protein
MSHQLIDTLEAVKVQHQDAHPVVVALGLKNGLVQSIDEASLVRQSREGILLAEGHESALQVLDVLLCLP